MKINKLTVAWNGFMASVEQAIGEWTPADCSTELEYRDDLVRYLRDCAPEARAEPEYRHEGTTADICFKWTGLIAEGQILIELKRNLKQKPQYDRLVGQLEGLDPRRHRVIVVLFGETNDTLLGRLRHHYRELLGSSDHNLALIVK